MEKETESIVGAKECVLKAFASRDETMIKPAKEKKRMDTNKVLLIYKQQLADVMEQRILLQAQAQELLQRVEELEKELEDLKKEKE